MEKIYFSKIKEDAKIPNKEPYNAGFDIYACFDDSYIIIQPHETILIPTGIASAIPEGYYIQIQERGSSGSLGIKYGAGVIDSSYRGEWFLATTNANDKPVLISKLNLDELDEDTRDIIKKVFIVYQYEKALFQGILHNINNDIQREEIPYEQLAKIPSQRGDGKLGSSGK